MNIIYLTIRIFYRMRLLEKWQKKYHKFLEMHHKNAIKKQKRSFLNAEKANKKQKKNTNKLLK